MNLLKILIPKDKAQEITELESWKVSWLVATSQRWGEQKVFYKCFVKQDEAKEFKKQLEKSAEFIKTPINTELEQN